MGLDVGRVTKVTIAGDQIRVDMAINRQVPLPADVHASIVPLSLIGERNIVLHPVYEQGMAKAKNGDVIPQSRTEVPVEPDEALEALTNLARAIDPTQIKRLVTSSAQALQGQGQNFNAALDQAGQLTNTLASQDQTLLAIAENFHQFANTLNSREQALIQLIQDFSTASGVLADERKAIGTFLSALAQLIDQGKALIVKYQTTLPSDFAQLAQYTITVRINADSVHTLLGSFIGSTHLLEGAYNAAYHEYNIRMSFTPDIARLIQESPLNQILTSLGLPPLPTCIPAIGVQCP